MSTLKNSFGAFKIDGSHLRDLEVLVFGEAGAPEDPLLRVDPRVQCSLPNTTSCVFVTCMHSCIRACKRVGACVCVCKLQKVCAFEWGIPTESLQQRLVAARPQSPNDGLRPWPNRSHNTTDCPWALGPISAVPILAQIFGSIHRGLQSGTHKTATLQKLHDVGFQTDFFFSHVFLLSRHTQMHAHCAQRLHRCPPSACEHMRTRTHVQARASVPC